MKKSEKTSKDLGSAQVPWLRGSRPPRIAVIGDVMLDEYLDGQVNRISPEAPVPVHLVTNTTHGAGGAANVARNIKLIGGEALLLSVIGDDEAARSLKALLAKDKIDTSKMVVVHDRPTIRKTRLTSNSHQIVRIDWERVHPISQDAQDRLLAALKTLEFDALLVSDYSKGTMTQSLLNAVLELAAARGVPSLVDPKGLEYGRYARATLVKPNRKEACKALGIDASGNYTGEDLGRRLQKAFSLQNVLVTMGSKGMVFVPAAADAAVIELPAIAREIYDVSGAGDTVISVMALCLACQAPMAESMHVSNTAAGLVVEKWGTQPVRLNELELALRERPDPKRFVFSSRGKISDRDTLRLILKEPATRSQKVVFTNGGFDIVHAGHVSYLEEARSLGDVLVVGINTDESVRASKGPTRPFNTLADRLRVLASLGCVDYVVPFGEDTPYDLIKALVPDVLVKGGDWNRDAKEGEKGYIVGSDIVKGAGGVVDTIQYLPGLSTTEIAARIKSTL